MTPALDRVVDEYGLSPMQQGMLYQTLASPGEGVYSIVVSYRLQGPLDAGRFVEAWRQVVAHHPILRTSFEARDRGRAVQIVHAGVTLEAYEEDWSALSPAEQAERLPCLLEAEQRRGFDPAQAPLLRLTLLRRGADDHEFVLAHHHLLMDGSCKPLLFSQVFSAYASLTEGRPVRLEPSRPFRDFIDWLDRQPLADAEAFWRRELHGVTGPSAVWPGHAPAAAPARPYEEYRTRLDEAGSQALRQYARRHRLTLNSVVSGVWALLLARCGGTGDVVFGATINARPPDLDGVESMLGLFINTIPARVHVEPAQAAAAWLQGLQRRQVAAREFGSASLSSIQRWVGLPGGQPLFDSLIVFENNAGYGGGSEQYGDIRIAAVEPVIRNSLSLTLRCVPDREIEIHLLYDARRYRRDVIELIAEQVVGALHALPHDDHATAADVLDRLAAIERERVARDAQAYERAMRTGLRARARDPRRSTGEPS